jgi:hypothetical protein
VVEGITQPREAGGDDAGKWYCQESIVAVVEIAAA